MEQRVPAWEPGQQWEVSRDPAIVLGGGRGGGFGEFYDVAGVTRLADGRLIVGDGGNDEILAYSDRGVFLQRIARRGDGPGEFRRLMRLAKYRGDSILALNTHFGRLRFSLFGPDGTFARSWTVAAPAGEARVLNPEAFADDGYLLTVTSATLRPAAMPILERELERAYWYDPVGTPGPLVSRFPGRLRYRAPGDRMLMVPFTIGTLFAAAGRSFYAADPERFELRRYARDGSLERIIRIPYTALPVTQRHVHLETERLLEKQRAMFRGAPSGLPFLTALVRGQAAALKEVPFPDSFPPYERLWSDPTGHLWVQAYRRIGEDVSEMIVFDPDGRWLGAVELPADLTVHEIGRDYLLGVRSDELGVDFVQLHRLRRR